ncbi:hypothetical protein AGMMS49975_22710 [Clostridia bacterium]|nr:hypothetical protein AGMMS49975_22710 [Clostridia bacterium]
MKRLTAMILSVFLILTQFSFVHADDNITVYFRLTAKGADWVAPVKKVLPNGTTAKGLIDSFLASNNIEADIPNGAYINGLRRQGADWLKSGVWGSGAPDENAGWVFFVNGAEAQEGYSTYLLQPNDYVVLFYTMDFTSYPEAAGGGFNAPPDNIKNPPAPSPAPADTTPTDTTPPQTASYSSRPTTNEPDEPAPKPALPFGFTGDEDFTLNFEEPKTGESAPVEIAAKSNSVDINSEAFRKISDYAVLHNEPFTIKFKAMTIQFDSRSLSNIAHISSGGENIHILVSKSKDAGSKAKYSISIIAGGGKLADFGGNVTLRVPYKPPINADSELITAYGADGKIRSGGYYDADTGLFDMPLDKEIEFSIQKRHNPFKDVPANNKYYKYIISAFDKGLMDYASRGKFAPDADFTYAAAINALYRKAGSPEVEGLSPFDNVPSGAWYEDAAIWAFDEGLVPEGIFDADKPVTAAELSKLLKKPTDGAEDYVLNRGQAAEILVR